MLNEDNKVVKEVSDSGIILNRDKYPMLQKMIEQDGFNKVVLSKEIHLEEDLYLLDHKVYPSGYIVPGLFHVEAQVETAWFMEKLLSKPEDICFGVRNVMLYKFIKHFPQNPLTLRYEGLFIKEEGGRKEYKVKIVSDFVNARGMILEKNRSHSEGEVIFFDHMPPAPKPLIRLETALDNAREVDLDKFYNLTNSIMSFGPVFRQLEKAWYISENEMVGVIHITNNNQLFSYTTRPDFLIAPILVDSGGRLCLFPDFQDNGYIVVPIRFGEMFRYGKMPVIGGKIYSYVKFKKRENELLYFDMQLLDTVNNKVYMDIKDIVMIRFAKVEVDHNIVL